MTSSPGRSRSPVRAAALAFAANPVCLAARFALPGAAPPRPPEAA
jgi:hypothetical protein